ncbi:MAG: UbiD family decarboxylase [Candidatus Micrarchaeaceae archaeon]
MPDFSLSGYVRSLKESPLNAGTIERAYAPAKILAENETKRMVKFRFRDSKYEIVGNLLRSRDQIWHALGAGSDEEAYSKILDAIEKPGKAVERKFSLKKANATLHDLPFILYFPGDGGMYLTSGVVFAKNNSIANASFHRMLLLSDHRAVLRIVPRHLYTMLKEKNKTGEDLPVAIIVGMHPIAQLAAAMSPRYGIFEMDVAAKLLPGFEIAYTPKYNIPVPASASVVVEGKILREKASEGPFVDLTSTYDMTREEPIFEAETFYESEEPLLNTILSGGIEHKLLMGYPREAAIYETVSRAVPKVKKVRLTSGGGMWLHCALSIEKNTDGDPKTAMLAAFTGHTSLKSVVVVDPDVDIDNLEDLEWAISTRFQPNKLLIINEARGSSLDPSAKDGMTSKMGIDATAPISDSGRYAKSRLPELKPLPADVKADLEKLLGEKRLKGYSKYIADGIVTVFGDTTLSELRGYKVKVVRV